MVFTEMIFRELHSTFYSFSETRSPPNNVSYLIQGIFFLYIPFQSYTSSRDPWKVSIMTHHNYKNYTNIGENPKNTF